MRTCAKIVLIYFIIMTEQFLNIISIDLDNFLYYNHQNKSYVICDRKNMMEWQKDKSIKLKLQYLTQHEARKVSLRVNKEKNFNLKVEQLQMLQEQDKSLSPNLEHEIDNIRLNQISRMDYIKGTIQNQCKILDSANRFIYPELFNVIEDSIEQLRVILEQESTRYESEINESETRLKTQVLDNAIKQQQEFTEFLKNKFKPQSYLDLPE